MTDRNDEISILQNCVSNPQDTLQLVDYTENSIVSKTILDKPAGTITLFAFDAGQELSEHTAPYNAVVQVLDGTARLSIGGQIVSVSAGQVIIMPANVPHGVSAQEKFRMLLTMIRS